jgi:hypothetical protein
MIQRLYENTTKDLQNMDWGKMDIIVKPFPTIVTMIYDIRKRESPEQVSKCSFNHKIKKYLDDAHKFILTLPYPLIVFTDEDYIIDEIKERATFFKILGSYPASEPLL